jgi:hypothetical protein
MSIPKRIQELFFSKLEQQTNWGRIQLKQLYLECVAEAYYTQDQPNTLTKSADTLISTDVDLTRIPLSTPTDNDPVF